MKGMDREQKRKILKLQRENLIQRLEEVYRNAFDKLSTIDIEEGSIAKLSQAFLLSREAAIKHLQEEVEKPIITQSPKSKT